MLKYLLLYIFFAIVVTCVLIAVILLLHRLQDEETGVDVVYTFVDGLDPRFRKAKLKTGLQDSTADGRTMRYQQFREIYYSLFSIKTFAPWVRKIHIVTGFVQVR